MNKKNKPSSPGAVFSSPQELEKKLDEYFGSYLEEKEEIADIESLADFFNITREDLLSYMSDRKYGRLLRIARNRIAKIKKQLAFKGVLKVTMFRFDFKNNHGYKDKPEDNDIAEPVVFKGKTGSWAK